MKPIVVVECGNDELLLLELGLVRNRVQHEGNRDEVVKYILNHEPGRYVGMIDEDPGSTRNEHRSKFKKTAQGAGLHVEEAGRRRLVVLHPFLEGWLVAAMRDAGGSIARLDKGLSDNATRLHHQLRGSGDPRLKKIIAHLLQARSKHVAALKHALMIP